MHKMPKVAVEYHDDKNKFKELISKFYKSSSFQKNA